MIKNVFVLFFLFRAFIAFGQDTVLSRYIEEGLKNNLALQQKEFSCQRSSAALKEARGMFLPSVGIEARYSRAGGGRIIDIPIGDLMNPVYGTLNTLLQSVGYPPMFPTTLANQSVPFLRKEEQDTKVRLIQPIFQPAIAANYGIRRGLRNLEQASRDAYARQLVAEIQTAYYNYLKTVRIGALLADTERLLHENLRITKSLAENGKANPAAVYRAEAEMQAFFQQKAEADKSRNLAGAYFNFLLNRQMDSLIDIPADETGEIVNVPSAEIGEDLALQNREELRQLAEAITILKNKKRYSQAAFLPGIAAVVDFGYQGEMYRFKPEDDYWMASVVASWNLFSGFQDKYKIDQTRLEQKEAEVKLQEVRSQIRLQAREACQNVLVAVRSLEAAQAREKASRKSYEAVDKRFREGMAPQIEYIDARNTLTQAEVNAIVSRYECFIRKAEYEKVTAGFPLKY